jgi:hypothetical protein
MMPDIAAAMFDDRYISSTGSRGGLINDPTPTMAQRHLGTADISFQSCTSMTIAY